MRLLARVPTLAVALGAAAVVALAAVVGCGNDSGAGSPTAGPDAPFVLANWRRTGEGPIGVVVTTGQVADLARRIGGAHVDVTQIMGAGVDPHLYQPREADMRAFDRAEAILYHGLRLEGRLGDVLRRMGARKPVVAVAERLPRERLIVEDGGEVDPHVWFDPELWQEAARVVGNAFAAIEPAHAEQFHMAAATYVQEITIEHARLRHTLADVPAAHRVLVTAHDAFQYFGRAFDLEVMGIQGLSTEGDASVRHIEALVTLLVEREIKAVFVETSVAERNVVALIEGAEARGHRVAIGGSLYSDAMGEPDSPTGTYLGMLRHNVETIAAALR